MKIGEVCNREVVIIDQHDSILDAAKLMRHLHVGDVVVVGDMQSDRHPVGILTDRDIVVELVALKVDPEAVSIGEAMSFELVTAREEDGVDETVEKMRARGIRRVPVVNGEGGLEGIFSLDDYIELLAEQFGNLVQVIKTEQRQESRERP